MRPRIIAFAVLAALLAAVFVRLGFWQLDRLSERRARNDTLRARLAEPEVDLAQLRDTSGYQRASVTGAPDYANEILYIGRSRAGSPGVYVVTPLRRAGNDTAIAVIRGWVYAPDAATIDQAQWREDRATFRGYVLALAEGGVTPTPPVGRKVRALTRDALRALMPYPVSPLYLVALDTGSGQVPARLEPPRLDNGPHLTYAIQWFCFAAIALGGAVIVSVRSRAPDGP